MAKKTSVKITGTKQASENAIKFLNTVTKDKDFLDEIGKTTSDQIRLRTRARLEEYRQIDLEESTVDRRKTLIKQGNALDAKSVSAKRSNLTLSGQLLNAIKYRIQDATSSVILFIETSRRAYKGKRGQALENLSNNLEIKNDLEQQGRRFFFISEKLKTLLESKIAQQLRRKLSLYNKVKRKLSL